MRKMVCWQFLDRSKNRSLRILHHEVKPGLGIEYCHVSRRSKIVDVSNRQHLLDQGKRRDRIINILAKTSWTVCDSQQNGVKDCLQRLSDLSRCEFKFGKVMFFAIHSPSELFCRMSKRNNDRAANINFKRR